MHTTQSVKWNEMYKWKDDMKHPGYEPELICAQGYNLDHTISGHGTAVSTLDHLAITPRARIQTSEHSPVITEINLCVT